jgi:hypothetical protein
MKIYYSLDSIPELAGHPRTERRRLFLLSYCRLLGSLRCWILLLVLLAAFALLGMVLAGSLGSVIGIIVAVFIGHQILFRMQRPIIRQLKEEARKTEG